ncbi:MAG: hypothetical protein WCL02_05245 [bacterium]
MQKISNVRETIKEKHEELTWKYTTVATIEAVCACALILGLSSMLFDWTMEQDAKMEEKADKLYGERDLMKQVEKTKYVMQTIKNLSDITQQDTISPIKIDDKEVLVKYKKDGTLTVEIQDKEKTTQ